MKQECPRCKSVLPPAALVCEACHALVHSTRLEQLSASARMHEERREYAEARGDWSKALELLPPDSSQAEWINGNLKRLEALDGAAHANDKHAWARKFGPFAPLIILLANGKFLLALFKLKFLLSLGAFVAFYWALFGCRFGIGFAILILVHEMGHFIEIKRRGLPAEMPVFLPGLGAYVRWTALGVSMQTRAFVSLAGPMAGCLAAAMCALVWMKTGDALWIGLAGVSAMLNVLNLIPIWVLDGSQAIIALNKTERILLSGAAVLFAAYFSQPLFLLVAAGAAYRIFTKDIPEAPSHAATAYYFIVLAALGYVISLAPLPAAAAR
ncbi:MAG TPA: site-2 protease family protein [Xanthobacteraceae bacterium]